MIERRPRAPVLRSMARLAMRRQRVLVEGELDVLHLEQPLILLDQRVLRLGQDLDQRRLVEVFQRRQNRQAADEFRDQAEFQQIFGLDLAEDVAGAAVFRRCNLSRRSRSRSSGRDPR